MPMPKPGKNESKKGFADRFMANKAMVEEYPDVKQRYAVCMSQLRRKGRDNV